MAIKLICNVCKSEVEVGNIHGVKNVKEKNSVVIVPATETDVVTFKTHICKNCFDLLIGEK